MTDEPGGTAAQAQPANESSRDGGEAHPPTADASPGHDELAVPSLRARHVYLRPLTARDYPYLQMVEAGTELTFRWRLRGATPSPEQWAKMIWNQVLAQFMVVGRSGDKPIGLVSVYRANFQDRYAYLSATRFEPNRPSPLMMLGVFLFLKYVFTSWDFRKLYMELPEFNMPQFASGLGRYFEVEGRLRDHFYFDGRYWDQLTLATYRDVWQRHRDRLFVERGKGTSLA
jgi:RimJ/RimL family protein N-acetyltransferase